MRKEASLEQWKVLYEAATRIKELKPWEKFWDMDLIGIKYGKEEDTVFFSILGRGGSCYGISVYEGYEGLNKFLMLAMQQSLNLSVEYVMCNQKNLTCYWGNREELTDKQRKIIKDLGYSYRGKNQWLYFLSFEPGYYPYNLDSEEVIRLSEYFQDLELALKCYHDENVNVDFEKSNMFLFSFSEDKKTWDFGETPLPFTSFQFGNMLITDEKLLADLANAPKGKAVLEADIIPTRARVNDRKYSRPANPALALLGDASSGMIVTFKMTEPDDDPIVMLAETVIRFVFQYGTPREIRVANVIVEAGLKQLCDICRIKLRRVKRLPGLEEFIHSMGRFNL